MAQIVIRGIDESAMAWLRRRAERLGWSKEQLARSILEREAESEVGWARFETRARRIRERLRKEHGTYGDSTPEVREDRDR